MLEQRLFQGVRKRGGLAYKIAPTTAGLPDRLVIAAGLVMLVELKRRGEGLRPIQEVEHKKIRKRGGVVHVLHGPEGVDAFLLALPQPRGSRWD